MKWEGRVAEPQGVMTFTANHVTFHIELKSFVEFNAIQQYVEQEKNRARANAARQLRALAEEMEK